MVGSHAGQKCIIRNWILFANPLDGGMTWPGQSRALILLLKGAEDQHEVRGCGESRWKRTGESFDTLSCTPSFDAYRCGHLTLTNGEFR